MKISEVPILGQRFWKELGGKIPFWVKEDAVKSGLMQDNRQKLRYRSKEYVKYKANRFERFKDTKWGKKGTKIKAFATVSVEPPNVAFVNLTASGRMLNSLGVKTQTEDSVTMVFKGQPAGKILGNRDNGYDAIGLNDKNRRLVKVEIIKELKKRKLEIPKQITIYVGK